MYAAHKNITTYTPCTKIKSWASTHNKYVQPLSSLMCKGSLPRDRTRDRSPGTMGPRWHQGRWRRHLHCSRYASERRVPGGTVIRRGVHLCPRAPKNTFPRDATDIGRAAPRRCTQPSNPLHCIVNTTVTKNFITKRNFQEENFGRKQNIGRRAL